MEHRHLNHQRYTLAAIDDVIARGRRADWAALGRAFAEDPSLGAKILRVCEASCGDRSAQRHHFWRMYVERRSAA